MMRVAVNGKSLGIAQAGGAVRVALNLIDHLAALPDDIQLDVFLPTAVDPTSSLKAGTNLRLIEPSGKHYRSGLQKSFWEQWLLPARIKQQGPYALLLNLTNSAPVLRSPGIPQLLLMHDAGFLHTEWFSRSYSRYVSALLKAAVRRGIQLVTVSETSASQIRNAFPAIPHIDAVANGVDPAPADFPDVMTTQPFVLFLGSINPRKNLTGALRAFALLHQQHPELQLLVAGAEKKLFANQDFDRETMQQVKFLGYVDEADKWALLKQAQALLLPSFLEGFGLPIAEAMQLGTPAVVSDIPVFRELFGEIPFYVEPGSPQSIARGLTRALSEGRSPDRIQAAQDCVRDYTWAAAAQQYAHIMRRIAESGGRSA